jgi:hypothetical protein
MSMDLEGVLCALRCALSIIFGHRIKTAFNKLLSLVRCIRTCATEKDEIVRCGMGHGLLFYDLDAAPGPYFIINLLMLQYNGIDSFYDTH